MIRVDSVWRLKIMPVLMYQQPQGPKPSRKRPEIRSREREVRRKKFLNEL
jgi:hypothetical protein